MRNPQGPGTITVGFSLMLCCFPLRERSNWLWQRTPTGFCAGPFRFSLRRETAQR
jgi:hypothetical protein